MNRPAIPRATAPSQPAMRPRPLHLHLVQPPGRVEALAGLDAACLLRDQVAALGVPVTLGRDGLRADAVNLVFGAAWGFDADAAQGFVCALVETDPRGAAAPLSSPHRRLQQRLVVLRPAGLEPDAGASPPVAPRGLAWPVVQGPAATPLAPALATRPIPLLLVQPLSARRARWVARIEAAGCRVARLDPTLVAEERLALVRQARAVLLLRDDDDGLHDSVAAALALQAGTPVIAEGPPAAWPDAASAGTVIGIDEGMLDEFFGAHWTSGAWLAQAQACLAVAQGLDRGDDWRATWAALQQLPPLAGPAPSHVVRVHGGAVARAPIGWRPAQALEGAAALAPGAQAAPTDLAQVALTDLAQVAPTDLAQVAPTDLAQVALTDLAQVALWREADPVDVASHAAEVLCARALAHLAPGGTLVFVTPLPADCGASHAGLEALAAWLTQQVQRLSWPGAGGTAIAHRLALTHCGWLDGSHRPTAAAQARRARLVFTKVDTSYAERTLARSMHPGWALSGA